MRSLTNSCESKVLVVSFQKDLVESTLSLESNSHVSATSEDFEDVFELDSKKSLDACANKTPQFLLDMINYCMGEVRETASDRVLDEYGECVRDLCTRLGSPDYPLRQVSSADEKKLLSELDVIQRDMQKSAASHDDKEASLLSHANADIERLKNKFKALFFDADFKPPPLENRSLAWADPASFGQKLRSDSDVGKALDKSFSSQLEGLEEFEYFPILGDGACWVRALWQATLAQVLDSPFAFKQFVQRVEACNVEFKSDPQFFRNNNLSDVIAILKKLRSINEKGRLQMLNRSKPDMCLQMFVRKLVAAITRREAENAKEIEKYLARLELPSTFGGAQEINCFLKFFEISVSEVASVYKEGKSKAQYHLYNSDAESNSNHELPKVMLFGINPLHYCVLRKK